MRKIQSPPSLPAVNITKASVEIEVSTAYLGRQSTPGRLTRPTPDVFHDSDLKPLNLPRTEFRQLKSHLQGVGLLKARSLPGTFVFKGHDIDAAVSSAPLSPPHVELAKAALTTLHQDSRRLGALRAAKRHLDASIVAEPHAAAQQATLQRALQREMTVPAPLLDTLRDMQQVLLDTPQPVPFDLKSLPPRSQR